jgi:hypothetical protein
MGRIWDAQTVPQMSFNLQDGNVVIQWASMTVSSQFNLYRRNAASPLPPVRLNSTPLTQATYLDPAPPRGELYEYQIEEVRSDGTRYFLPPQKYRIGGLPTSAYLSQNFPNPFNSSTTIIYGVPTPSQASLLVYNPLGQLVRTLVDDRREQGEYEVFWDGKDQSGSAAASGVYFFVFSTEVFRSTSKVLLVR